jgi:ribosomal protein L7/L12
MPAGVLDALQRGNKIEAIKLYREATGAGLAEASDQVEEWQANSQATH